MPTFIDESGDTSAHRDAKPYYRLAAVWVPSRERADEFCKAFAAVRSAQQWKANFECKYVKTHHFPNRRRAVFEAALAHEFRFAACCINKAPTGFRWAEPIDLYYPAAMTLATTLRPLLIRSRQTAGRRVPEPVIVDDNEDRTFLAAIEYAFHQLRAPGAPDVPLTDKPVWRNSARDPMLQLADLVCGAIGEHIEGDSTWYEFIKSAGEGPNCGFGRGVTYWS